MLKDAFINLICLSAIIGVFCFVNSISLPQPIFDVLQYSANTTVCLSMIYIGSLLAAANVREIFKDKKGLYFQLPYADYYAHHYEAHLRNLHERHGTERTGGADGDTCGGGVALLCRSLWQ